MREEISWRAAVQTMTERLVAIASVSPDRKGENLCADEIASLLGPESSEDASTLTSWPVPGGRKSVACFLEGRHPENRGDTVILMGHFDTVGMQEFRTRFDDPGVALRPDELLRRLLSSPSRSGETEAAARRDLRERWLPEDGGPPRRAWMLGRGALDMKSGLAALVAVFRRLRLHPERLAGNVLLLACPDEENESQGVRSAVPKLLELRQRKGLRYLGAINADYTAPRGQSESERFIYVGTVGKLLPCFYVLGVRTHVGEAFRGFDAAEAAAQLISRINLNPRLADVWEGRIEDRPSREVALPPIALHSRDLKESYNVETAGAAFVYFNWLTHRLDPAQALSRMKQISGEALEAVAQRQSEQWEEFTKRGGQAPKPPAWTPRILEFGELAEMAESNWDESVEGVSFRSWKKALLDAGWDEPGDSRQQSRRAVEKFVAKAGLTGPAVVIFFSPPFYPHLQPLSNRLTESTAAVLSQLNSPQESPLRRKLAAAGSGGQSVQLRGFYPYISDLSYLDLEARAGQNLGSLQRNMPLFDACYGSEFDRIQALACPVVNIGPWGKDAHGLFERVHLPYSFEFVPQLILETVEKALCPD